LENERDFTKLNLASSEAGVTVARAEYGQAVASKNSYGYDVQVLAQDLALAQLRVERLERGVDPLLALEVEKAGLRIERLRARQEDAQLVASIDGEVLSVSVKDGSHAVAYKGVLVLGDTGALEITANLGATDLAELSVGQPATIHLRSRPEEDLVGVVRQLPYAYSGGAVSGGAAQDEDDTAVRVALSDDRRVQLELGELATVIIVLVQKQEVLWLPPAALRTFQGRDFVVIQDEDRQQRVDVRLGIESEERVELLEGVEEGQIVVGP
jgi:multidrug resistance efflux pump